MGKTKNKNPIAVNPFSRLVQPKQQEPKPENEEAQDSKDEIPEVTLPSRDNYNHIKCKAVRQEKNAKFMKEKAKAKKAERKARIQAGVPKQVPRTLENTREADETTVQGNIDDEENEEIKHDFEHDEFASYYQQSYEPKVLITYADNPLQKTRIFGRELTRMIPNSISLYRNRSGVKKMVKSATAKGFTDIIVINENQRQPSTKFFFGNFGGEWFF